MAKHNNKRGSLADPSRLQPLDDDFQHIINVVIETHKGCRNKYAFDPELKVFELRRVPLWA
jgi:inorganic pyrophosphatase